MAKRIFITGIGTDVGKTIVSAVLVEALKADYWKPVQTGNNDNRDSVTVKNLVSNSQTAVYPEQYSFRLGASPHQAAEEEGPQIFVHDFILPETENDTLIIEGAGGVLVPLNQTETILDLIMHLDASVILVTSHYLGSINHTLLSVQALKNANVNVLGIIVSGDAHESSEKAIKSLSGLPILGRVEKLPEITPESILEQARKFNHLRF